MTDQLRTALYTASVAILGVLAAFGWINADQEEMLVVAVGATLTALTALLSAVKTWQQRHDTVNRERKTRGLLEIDRVVGNEDTLDVDEVARIRKILQDKLPDVE